MKNKIEAIVNSLSQLTEVPDDRSNLEMPSALAYYHFITNSQSDDSNSLVKKRVFRTNPNHLPCTNCGSTSRKLGAGRKAHEMSLLCRCGNFLGWIRGSQLAAIAAQLNQGGLQ
jgi:hypothetical protein